MYVYIYRHVYNMYKHTSVRHNTCTIENGMISLRAKAIRYGS